MPVSAARPHEWLLCGWCAVELLPTAVTLLPIYSRPVNVHEAKCVSYARSALKTDSIVVPFIICNDLRHLHPHRSTDLLPSNRPASQARLFVPTTLLSNRIARTTKTKFSAYPGQSTPPSFFSCPCHPLEVVLKMAPIRARRAKKLCDKNIHCLQNRT